MHATPQRSYGGQSAEARRERRRSALLNAAIEAMVANEWRSVTVEKLCAAAGLNKRYFYESFAGLDEVGAAVVDDIADEVRASTMAALTQAGSDDVAGQAAAVVDALVRTLVADPRRARVLLGGVTSSPVLHQHRSAVMVGLTGVLMAHARTIHDVELERDPLAQVAPAFLIGGTADAILAFVDGRAKVSVDDLISSLTALWLITGNGAAEVARLRLGEELS
ncbi:TetR/AcrR family transcriptional regulator [Mycolicibacterium iranicum]|uniref:TetR/AcrR family transcriptional regulator n=1 Tax=Mycolicibacterium iranicum TaxID=912594 RepID=UPI0004631093|nr:TetR/AcrR family transcriptional regulator [Mycolicibacterium iranicum]